MKYLITGLGNIGEAYATTRHNIGFIVADYLVRHLQGSFKVESLGSISKVEHKGRAIYVLKPSTYMNLSGKAVRYWLQRLKIPVERSLVVVDDLHLEVGALRLSPKGSSGGHNGLKSIEEYLETSRYARLRFGIGKNFLPGGQAGYVLANFTADEVPVVKSAVIQTAEIVRSFCFQGLMRTMNAYNGLKNKQGEK